MHHFAAFTLSLATVVFGHTNALAARPLVTDDAGVPTEGNFEFQLYGLRQTARGSPSTSGAHADFSYSIAPIHIGPTQVGVSAERTSSTGLASDTVGLWGKTALPQGFIGGVDFGLAYAFSWSRGVASRYGHEGAELKALASAALGPLVVHANAGARYIKVERTSKFVWALAAEQPRAMGPIDLGIESFGVAGEAAWVQAVLRWELVKDQWQVDASIGREVKHGVARVFTVGLKESF